MKINEYTASLDTRAPSRDHVVVAYLPGTVTGAAELLSRLTGQSLAVMRDYLALCDERLTGEMAANPGLPVVLSTHLERCRTMEELGRRGSYTKQLVKRVAKPPRTCGVALAVASEFHDGVLVDLKTVMERNPKSVGVVLVRAEGWVTRGMTDAEYEMGSNDEPFRWVVLEAAAA